MAFKFTGTQLERLRTQIFNRFDRDTFSLFVSDRLQVHNFRSVVPETDFENQCQAFILLMTNDGKLDRLCIELRDARGNIPGLVTITSEILAAMNAATPGTGQRHSLMIGQRPFLNRDSLRRRLVTFVEGNGLDRVLIIEGQEATGKSYSRHLISHGASMEFASVELPAIVGGEYEASHVASAVCVRLWPEDPLDRFDDLGQSARDSKWYGDRVVARLSRLPVPTLLFIDGFNTAPLAKGASDLLIRFCRAVENCECRNLWLVFVGLDAGCLGPEYEDIVEPEKACPPAQAHIEDFLRNIPPRSGQAVDPAKIAADAMQLAGVLGTKPTHATWAEFSRQLTRTSKTIRSS